MNQEHSTSPQPSQSLPPQSPTLSASRKRWALAGICGALLVLSGFILNPANGTDVATSTVIPKAGSSPSRPVPRIAAALSHHRKGDRRFRGRRSETRQSQTARRL